MMNKFGVMQGRLLPKYKGRYQAHPKNYWHEEFYIAEKLGLDCIEFILDFEDYEKNPLMSKDGLRTIEDIIVNTGIEVISVCADYFMQSPLFGDDNEKGLETLEYLICNLNTIRVKDIVLPCVDNSSLLNNNSIDLFIKSLSDFRPLLKKNDINISLETDLPPKEFRDLIEIINSKNVRINYDIGNSASLGYSLKEELMEYGNYISDIHIKDRKLNGESVMLGQGDADFKYFFELLKKFNYQGPFIMQAFRDDEGVEIFNKQYKYIKPLIELYNE